MNPALRLPAGRPGQVLAIGLTLVFFLLLWEAAVSPLIALYESRASEVATAQARATRSASLAAALPALRAEAGRVARSGPTSSSLLDGATDAVAAAALQGKVQDLAAAAGTSLSSTEALAARQEGRYRRIGLRVSVSATLPVLVRLIQSIESDAPRMLVDDLQLHASPMLIAGGHEGSPALDASMTVIGFRAGQTDDSDEAGSGGASQDNSGAGNSGDSP